MPTLCSLPSEIREGIYSYLLDTCYVPLSLAPLSSGKKQSEQRLATSLFLVNKQISREATRFFYGTNAFTITQIQPFQPCDPFDLELILPSSKILEGRKQLSRHDQRFILYAQVRYQARGDWYKFRTLVTPKHELPLLIRLVNQHLWSQWMEGFNGRIELQSNILSPLFRDKYKLVYDVLKSLEMLRSPEPKGSTRYFQVKLGGHFMRFKERLQTNSIPCYCEEDILPYCLKRMEVASLDVKRGAFEEALNGAVTVELLNPYCYKAALPDSDQNPFRRMRRDTSLLKALCCSKIDEDYREDVVDYIEQAFEDHCRLAQSRFKQTSTPHHFPESYFYGLDLFPVNPFGQALSAAETMLRDWKPLKGKEKEKSESIQYVRGMRLGVKGLRECFKEEFPDEHRRLCGADVKCSYCGEDMQNRSRLWQHLRDKHWDSRKCVRCKKQMISKSALFQHMRDKHGESRPLRSGRFAPPSHPRTERDEIVQIGAVVRRAAQILLRP